jgi:hypothetical protein
MDPASAEKFGRGTDRGAQGNRRHDNVRVRFGTNQVAEVDRAGTQKGEQTRRRTVLRCGGCGVDWCRKCIRRTVTVLRLEVCACAYCARLALSITPHDSRQPSSARVVKRLRV